MRNFCKRLAGLSLGLLMALGIGAAVGQHAAINVKADEETVTTIEDVYSMESKSSVTNVYGYYVGAISGSSYIMDGELGMMLYKKSPESAWKVGETLLKVTKSTLSIYNSVYELTSVTCEVSTDTAKAKVPVTYQITGSEAATDSKLWNRLASATGVPSGITATSYSAANTTFKIKVGTNDVTVHIKSADYTEDIYNSLKKAQDASTEITVVGITSVYNSKFQLGGMYVIEKDTSYTADKFAEELLSSTDEACTYSKEHSWEDVSSQLGSVWTTLETDFKGKLAATEQTKLVEASAKEDGTTIEKAVHRYIHIVNRYKLANFMNRTDVNKSVSQFVSNSNNNLTISIIILVSIISVSLIVGTTLIIRKRKVN